MNYRVVILSEAELDIDEAFIWYELAQIGLGKRFFESVDKSIQFIPKRPISCALVHKGLRRFVIGKFPYGIYYRINLENKEVQIVAIIHFKRSPRNLRRRIQK